MPEWSNKNLPSTLSRFPFFSPPIMHSNCICNVKTCHTVTLLNYTLKTQCGLELSSMAVADSQENQTPLHYLTSIICRGEVKGWTPHCSSLLPLSIVKDVNGCNKATRCQLDHLVVESRASLQLLYFLWLVVSPDVYEGGRSLHNGLIFHSNKPFFVLKSLGGKNYYCGQRIKAQPTSL